jgi:hypothetical protein
MPQRHEHVDLAVLHEVEELLTQVPLDAPAPDGESGAARVATLRVLVPADEAGLEGDPGTSHPSAHVPRGATIAEAPVTPLPRRR